LFRLGHVAEGEAIFAEAARLTSRDGRSDLAVVLWTNSAAAAACRGEFRKALEYAQLGETASLADRTSTSSRWPGRPMRCRGWASTPMRWPPRND
jgi:hypothetical protein